jgi:hypothetical protein
MRQEGYTPEHIKQCCEFVHDSELAKIRKAGLRWKLYGKGDNHLMIKAFDHLKLIV